MAESHNSESIKIKSVETEKINSLREFVTSVEGQEKITGFIENLKSTLGNKEGWINTCQKADEDLNLLPVTEKTIETINQSFKTYIDQMPPGHDLGHFSRDFLTSVVLYDSIKDKVAYKSEAIAGLLAGTFHDIGTSIIPRYQDNKFGAGHGETGAYLFWQVSDGLIDENTRKLTCYSIAAHAHYLKPIEVQIPNAYKKDKFWDETWQNEDGKLIGVAPQITRRSDRADTNGVTLLMRHINSRIDSIEEGGQDLSGGEWVNLNQDSLIQTLNPVVRETVQNPPTSLEHVLRFAKSNDGNNPYSEKDYLFPVFKEILNLKLSQTDTLINVIDQSNIFTQESEENNVFVHDLFKHVSKSNPQRFEKAWENFQSIWQGLTSEDKSKWYNGFKYSEIAYNQILSYYQEKTKDSEFSNLAKKTIVMLQG